MQGPVVVQPIWDASTIPIVVTDMSVDGDRAIIRYVNEAFTRMVGYRRDEIIGRTPHILHARQTDRLAFMELKAALGENRAGRATAYNQRKNGEVYLCDITAAPLLQDDGTATHAIAFEQEVEPGHTPWDRTTRSALGNGNPQPYFRPDAAARIKPIASDDPLHILAEWYRDQCGPRQVLLRDELDLRPFGPFLGSMFLAKKDQHGHWTIAVWGSKLCSLYGRNYTGTEPSRNTPRAYWEALHTAIEECHWERRPWFAPLELRTDGRNCLFDRLLLPMTSQADSQRVDQVLGIVKPRVNAEVDLPFATVPID